MNNRYLYRAKRIDNDAWIEGYLIQTAEHSYIITFCENLPIPNKENMIEIEPSTICQCTEHKDKNDKLVWENDIVKDNKGNLYKAHWQEAYYQFSWVCIKSETLPFGAKWELWSLKSYEIEIIGSITDNLEFRPSPESEV